jgi:hypothetical protein
LDPVLSTGIKVLCSSTRHHQLLAIPDLSWLLVLLHIQFLHTLLAVDGDRDLYEMMPVYCDEGASSWVCKRQM